MLDFQDYRNQLITALDTVDQQKINMLYHDLKFEERHVYIFGNGGSAAIANHWVCDLSKGMKEDTDQHRVAVSLCSNTPLIMAIANDIGYEYVFSKQLEYLNPSPSDFAIAISSSGNSKNVINGLKKAKELDMWTVALTGFTGGQASTMADISIHVQASNYGIIEDIHMMILHSISQRLRQRFASDLNSLVL